jgi:hypothetical protein
MGLAFLAFPVLAAAAHQRARVANFELKVCKQIIAGEYAIPVFVDVGIANAGRNVDLPPSF